MLFYHQIKRDRREKKKKHNEVNVDDEQKSNKTTTKKSRSQFGQSPIRIVHKINNDTRNNNKKTVDDEPRTLFSI